MEKTKNKIPFLSSSIISSYLSCKYSFWKTYIQNDGFKTYRVDEESENPIYLTFGTLIHGVIEQFWKGNNRTLSYLKKTYETDLISIGFNDKSYIDLGYVMLDNFFDYLLTRAPKRKAVASELSFNVTISGVPLHGTIDQIFYLGDGIYEIEDYKTSKWVPTKDEVDENIQLTMYDLVYINEAMKQFWYKGIKPKSIILSLHFLREGIVINTERTEYTRFNAINYFRLIYKQMQVLEDSKFYPSLNIFCGYCDCANECEAYNSVIEDTYEPIIPKEDVSETISAYNETKNRIKILESEVSAYYSQLIDYFKENPEPISCDGYDYFLSQDSRRFVKTDVAKKILMENELWNENDFINIPIGKLESLIKDSHPKVWDRVSTFAMGHNYGNPKLTTKKSPKLFKRTSSRIK